MKVWHEICGYLGTHSIGYLAQACRSLRDQLYSYAPLWDCGIYNCKGSLSQETLKSLSRRRVKFVKTIVFTEADELIGTLRQFALLEELKTLYLRINADIVCYDFLSARYAELQPLPAECLFLALHGKTATTSVHGLLKYIFSAMHHVEELHIFLQESLKYQQLFALLSLSSSPMISGGCNLKDLEVRLFDCNPNICLDKKRFSLKMFNATYTGLERIAVKSMGFMALTNFETMKCPDLIHMNVCKIPPVDLNISIRSVVSCTITCYDDSLPCPQNELTGFLFRLRNLQALDLSCFKQQTLTRDNLKTIISSCPKLVVLKILSENCLTEEAILVTITGLQDLEVLAFLHASPNSHTDSSHTLEFLQVTLTQAPKLRSLLGVKVDRLFDNCDLAKLKYITCTDGSIVKRSCTMPVVSTEHLLQYQSASLAHMLATPTSVVNI